MNRNISKARQNELYTLVAIGLVGWLTTAQVAAWVWPDLSEHSARNRAAVVLKRLIDRRQLLRRQSALGEWAYLLTRTGAAFANEKLVFEVCRHGYDLSQLDVSKQATIVAFLLTHKGALRFGPAGVRGAIRSGMIENTALRHADALIKDKNTGNWIPAMLARTLHPEALSKARRLRAATGRLELLGQPVLIRQFKKAMDADQEYLGGSW